MTTTMLRSALGTLVALTLFVAPAQAEPRIDRSVEAQRRVLIQVLNAYEFRLDKRALDKIGPDVAHLLVILSGEPRQRPAVRVRAVTALSVYPSERTRRYLEGLPFDPNLQKGSFGTQMRRQALQSLAVAFRGDLVGFIAGFREDKDPQIREASAIALGQTGSERAIEPLKAWLPHEEELFVREAVDRSLTRLMKRR